MAARYFRLFVVTSAVAWGLALVVGFALNVSIDTLQAAPSSTETSGSMIWFGPMDPIPRPEASPYPRIGSVDFIDLFKEDALWVKAASRVQVFKFFSQFPAPWLPGPTDAQLRQVMADLNRRGIAIDLDMGPLPNDSCGRNVEGFEGIEASLTLARRIKAAGGALSYISLDEPFFFGSVYTGTNACRWPADRVARELKTFFQAIRTIFPDVVIGDIEPVPHGITVAEAKSWLETYRAVTGSYPSFFHVDVGWERADWPEAVKELETFSQERDIAFGIIYNGDQDDTSDAAWLAHAEERMAIYENLAAGKPDHVIFQSWHDKPDYTLPETAPNTFTHLINRYFRTRTQIHLTANPPTAAGALQVTGSLTDIAGNPLADAPVELSVTPLSGPGVFAEYTLTGTVPAGVTQANVGFRVNDECGCSGRSEFFLYEARYVQGNETRNRVPNGNFSQGLQTWGFWGSGTARIERSDRGPGNMLHVKAMPTQGVSLNSQPFPVTAGATYTLTFAARVSPVSVGSGYFAVFLLEPSGEGRRDTIPLEPATITGTANTDGAGTYRLTLQGVPSARLKLRVKYSGVELPASVGDEGYWPAYAEQVLEQR